ncbi:hypothetical protein PsorP6_015492 [Peronosclerospora sorghi]|uniref:Uncharacterized protein n=1 Tax=Peronosclerospora sorghi TaxID=230839 RepID=A0ACC0WMP7_9STRA|nr:hypothetical protein PsorP6_015492 [Peronosclerospora sorghi]
MTHCLIETTDSLLNDDTVHFRSLLCSTALHRHQLQQLIALIVRLNNADNRARETVTLVSLEREWLEQNLDVNAATIETFLTFLTLETQSDRAQETEQQNKCRLLFEAVQRKELRTAHLTQHTNGYLSSWEVKFHLQEAAQWYSSTRGRSESNEASASTVRLLLQELRGAQQRGELQSLTLARPAFYVHVRCPNDERDRMDAHDVERWTHVLYAKHTHLELRQVARLGQLYRALCAAALPVASSGGAKETEKESEARVAKARVLETKLVQYFDNHEALTIESMDNGQCLKTLLQP